MAAPLTTGQLSTLPWVGFVPDDVASAPPVAVTRLAEALGLAPGALRSYGRRAHTRSDHLGQVAKYLGWKNAAAGSQEMKELEQFLTDRAMEHDSPTLLFNLAREYLMSAKVIRPGAITLAKMVGAAREAAGELTSHKVAHLLTMQVRSDLDLLLKVDAGLGLRLRRGRRRAGCRRRWSVGAGPAAPDQAVSIQNRGLSGSVR
ncbi:DUF4158 domain-containing protein [Nonomuraea sp. 3-1Str]|uniref:DUF4158 domain-containing protein n=1 Tax=Nonomuraea sp. 3-1Str TaxID=2929801 RepID=UPI0028618CA9|nr:DUF4158 domain-containing protein [Nonomuraea sp. 3-1Str]MDR8415223.1 DUF4158 domain-containing protein [Nonomuraea sp. 3-1Str]